MEVAVELPGEAHAAVHLDVLLGRLVVGLARGHPRRRRRDAQLGGVLGERPGAVVGVRPRQLDAHVHVGQLVLDGLERGDLPPEGEAAERVLARHVERGLRAADLLEGHQYRRAVEQPLHQRPALAGRAQGLGRGALEHDPRVRAGRVHGGEARAGDPRAGEIYQIEAGVVITLRGEDDREIGDVAVHHRELGAVEA